MNECLSVTIWDNNTTRLAEIDRNLHNAAKHLRLCIKTFIIAEPPLMARENLLARVPVLEIDGLYWSLRPAQSITEKQCLALLARFKAPLSMHQPTE